MLTKKSVFAILKAADFPTAGWQAPALEAAAQMIVDHLVRNNLLAADAGAEETVSVIRRLPESERKRIDFVCLRDIFAA